MSMDTDLGSEAAATPPQKPAHEAHQSIWAKLYRGETNFDFIGTRRRWYLGSALLILLCILSFAVRGFNFSIEFEGGTQF
ncbi:MAG: secF, partial [Pseudonocardiales bacterium]|nr:secF [Pseudonocardiales bacterium]